MKEQRKITGNIYNQKIGFLVAVYLLILLTKQAASQNDTSAQLPDSIVQYIAPIDYALMMHENTSWLVKASLIDNIWLNGRTYVKFGIEKRVFRPLTINLSYNPSYTITSFLKTVGILIQMFWNLRLAGIIVY